MNVCKFTKILVVFTFTIRLCFSIIACSSLGVNMGPSFFNMLMDILIGIICVILSFMIINIYEHHKSS